MTASPIGDAPPVLLALDASVTLAGAGGSRAVPLREFFLDYRKTAARPGEVLIDVRVPRAQPAIQRFYKVSKRVLDDISTVAAAFAVDIAADGRVERARIAYGGIAATPIRAAALEDALVGQPWRPETVAATASALRSIADGIGTPMTDLRGSAGYRRAMIGRLLEKCVADTANMAALVEAAQ
jgi:xanthine dehydrogenase small subunit